MNINTGCQNILIDNNDSDEEEEAQMVDEEEGEEDEPDFMDNSGKCWEFGSKIEDEKHLKEWCQNKMGGMIVGKEEKLTRQFHCQIKECQFKAIFLKSCSTIYTRNKHNHGMKNGKNIRRKNAKKTNLPSQSEYENDYVDHLGKLWSFHANVGKNISPEKLINKFGFTGIHNNGETTLKLRCTKVNPDGGRCPFVGIYLKSNGCLYTRGEHEHTKSRKTPQNIGDDYVDTYGKIWKFNKEIGQNIQNEMLLSKFGFTTISAKESTLILYCQTQRLGIKCKFAGIYLKSNGCLYTRGKHNHEKVPQKIRNHKPNVGEDYVDISGKIWPFHMKIGKHNVPNGIWRNRFGFCKIYQKQQTVNLHCDKRTTNGGKCLVKGIYVKANGCLYIRGKHEHK